MTLWALILLAAAKRTPDLPVQPDSPSRLLRARHVLLVKVEKIDIGAPAPSEAATNLFHAHLTARLLEVLKGKTAQKPGDKVVEEVIVFGSKRVEDVEEFPGVWAAAYPAEGETLIAFSAAKSDDLAKQLAETRVSGPGVTSPELAKESDLPGLRQALSAENEGGGPKGAVKRLEDHAQELGTVYPEWLWVRQGAGIRSDPVLFSRVMDVAEQIPAGPARDKLLEGAADSLSAVDSPPATDVNRLAVAWFRIAAHPGDPDHDTILDTYLPDLLGVSGSSAARTPDSVFRRFPGEREKAKALLKDDKRAAALKRWIEGG